LGLRWQDIDFEKRTLMVTHSLWRGQLLEPKTESSRVSVYLSDPLFDALVEHRERSVYSRPDDFVFCREDGSPADPEYLRRDVLYPALEEVGIKRLPRKHGFHLFRHSAATIVHAATSSVRF
jgi:integrase